MGNYNFFGKCVYKGSVYRLFYFRSISNILKYFERKIFTHTKIIFLFLDLQIGRIGICNKTYSHKYVKKL